MSVFVCKRCDATLTVAVSPVAFPDHAHQVYGYGLLGTLMEPGTYAVNPKPYGPPSRPWDEIAAEAIGVYAPRPTLSFGPRDAVVVSPGDILGTELMPGRLDGNCCGLAGSPDGPNLACARCGQPVATRIDDCGLWQAVWLDPRATRRIDDQIRATIGWSELRQAYPGLPPVEPLGYWSPVWEAAVGAALARIMAASGGERVAVPDGLCADVLRRSVDRLLPAGPAERTLALAGPGHPVAAADIVLVPTHPQTGEAWTATGSWRTVPLAWDVWAYLAFHHDRRPVPGAGAVPDVALRDDPPPLIPHLLFEPDPAVLLDTLARLPEVRQPWLRAIYDRLASMAGWRPVQPPRSVGIPESENAP